MKQLAFSICAFFSVSAFAQTSLTGYVTLQNSGGRSAFPATVSDSDASATQVDRDKGFFNLVFDDKKRGQDIQLEVELKGYEVVNYEDLVQHVSNVDDVQSPLKLYLSPVGQWQRYAAEYEAVYQKAIKNTYEVKLAELRRQLDNRTVESGESQILASQLTRNKELAEMYGWVIAQRLAKANLDEATARFVLAHRLFTEGKIDSVLIVLDEEKMRANLTALDRYKIERNELNVAEARKRIVDEFMVKARAHIIKLEFTNAERAFDMAVRTDSSSAKNWLEYASFLAAQGKLDAAQPIYEHCLTLQKTKTDLITTLDYLGLLYQDKANFPLAEKTYLRAIEIKELLAKESPETYEPELATSLNNLGLLYKAKNDFVRAEKNLLRALEIRERIAKDYPSNYEPAVAATLISLGLLYQDKDDFPRAEKTFIRALEIYERLAKENPEAYEPYLAKSLNNLAILYSDKSDFQNAEAIYLRALEIYERLAKENPRIYEPDVAVTLNHLGILYSEKNDFQLSQESFLRSLEIRERLAKENPMTYEPDLALALNNLGIVQKSLNQIPQAETSYLRALEIGERIAKTNPSTYELDLVGTLNNLATLYRENDDFSKAEANYLRALEIIERYAKENPWSYDYDLARTLNNLGVVYWNKDELSQAEKSYLRALEIYERLAKANPERYGTSLGYTLNNLGLLYQEKNDFAKAEKNYLGAVEIRKRLAQGNPTVFSIDLCWTYLNLSDYCFERLESSKGEKKWKDQGMDWLQKATQILSIYPDDFDQRIRLERRITNAESKFQNYDPALTAYKEKIRIQKAKIEAIAKDGDKVLEQSALVTIYEQMSREAPGNESVAVDLSGAYGSLSWYALFARDFSFAEASALKGIQSHSSADWVHTNLALALLFQGKYEAAKAIYLERKDKPYDTNSTWTMVFLADLDALEKEGITHPDVAKVRDLLKK